MTDLLEVTDATWRAAGYHQAGGFTVRAGAGGGQRVSCATAGAGWADADIGLAEACLSRLGQSPLFMVRPGEDGLDRALASRGYAIKDPVNIYEAMTAEVAGEPPALSTFTIWPPLEIMNELWCAADIGPARRAVMDRATGPRTAVLGRAGDRAAGCAFVAIHEDTAMIHALIVTPGARRQGLATHMMQAAAQWAQDHGAVRLSVLVTRDNQPANGLYASLGMRIVGQYHYRTHRT